MREAQTAGIRIALVEYAAFVHDLNLRDWQWIPDQYSFHRESQWYSLLGAAPFAFERAVQLTTTFGLRSHEIMRVTGTLVCILSLLLTGCITSRLVDVTVDRIDVVSAPNGLSADDAVEIFTHITQQRNAARIRGPIRLSANEFEYHSECVETNQSKTIGFTLLVRHKEISFLSSIYGSRSELSLAENLGSLVQQELERRGVKYRISRRAAWGNAS